MEGEDELVLVGSYKDMSLGFRFDLSKAIQSDLVFALGFLNSKIEPFAYKFAPLDVSKIEKFIVLKDSGLGAISNFLASNSPSAIKSVLESSANGNKDLLPIAESCFLSLLFKKAKVPFLPYEHFSSSLKSQSVKNDDFIGFVGKSGSWVAIKKLGLENAKEYEISAILCGINHTIISKTFDLLKTPKSTSVATESSKGKRKTYAFLAETLNSISSSNLTGSDLSCALYQALELLGFTAYATPGLLTKAYPDIKPPKVKGRKPK